ncbi:MAG: hypothetical protein K6V36_01710, partial [Anaerolineae bacterium]|nr:hypothetical protein [Anaerolineae bacterium]
SLAYGKAYRDHTELLEDVARSRQLALDLILGAALAFVPGGVGGLIGKAMTRVTTSEFLIEGVKELALYGMRIPQTLAAAAPPGEGLNAFPTNPLAWRDQVELRITSELLVATNMLLGWQNSANGNDPNFFLDFNPVQAMEQSLTIAKHKVAELQPVDQEEMARHFEKGMWAAWLKQYAYFLASRPVGPAGMPGGVRYYAQEDIAKKIRRRCQELGLDVERYAAVARARVEESAEALNR